MARSNLLGKKFKEFTYCMTTDWLEEFSNVTGEPLRHTEEAGQLVSVVPESVCGVIALAICQQRGFELFDALDVSWTDGTVMMGEKTYEWRRPLRANYPYRVKSEIVRVEEKEGKRGRFDVVAVGTQFLEADGTPAFVGTSGFVVFDKRRV